MRGWSLMKIDWGAEILRSAVKRAQTSNNIVKEFEWGGSCVLQHNAHPNGTVVTMALDGIGKGIKPCYAAIQSARGNKTVTARDLGRRGTALILDEFKPLHKSEEISDNAQFFILNQKGTSLKDVTKKKLGEIVSAITKKPDASVQDLPHVKKEPKNYIEAVTALLFNR